MDKGMGRALARAGAGGALAAVLAVLAAGVVAAGPQQSSAAPTSTIGGAASNILSPRQTGPVARAAAPVRRPAEATRHQGRSGGRPIEPVTALRRMWLASQPRDAISAPRRAYHGPAASPVAQWRGPTGFDISRYQCGNIPSAPAAISIVQVTGGALNYPPNPCYAREAAWAGANLSVYIYLDGLPNPAPGESLTGPASRCARVNPVCGAYDFGFNWARHWVAYSRHLGINPKLWWLDVETGAGWTSPAVNGGVIRGAADGLRLKGARIGVYSSPYQWATIAGALAFPGVPVWTAGAGNLTGPGFTATAYCSSPGHTFAGGRLTLVQWGYSGAFPGAYRGKSLYDQDYACNGADRPSYQVVGRDSPGRAAPAASRQGSGYLASSRPGAWSYWRGLVR